ncbi:hypothetical protein M422DRAFT_133624, partial [Sphaerobolus stellatus SS14]
LRVGNAYIGLATIEEGYRPVQLPPIYNYPRFVGQVTPQNPTYVFHESVVKEMTVAGLIYPQDRRIFVNDTVHSIAQFRVADWGMEKCSLSMVIPEYTDSPNTDITIIPSPTSFQIWRLNVDSELNTAKLSWKTRPPRRHFVGELTVGKNITAYLPEFPCTSGSLVSFELNCDSCLVDFW